MSSPSARPLAAALFTFLRCVMPSCAGLNHASGDTDNDGGAMLHALMRPRRTPPLVLALARCVPLRTPHACSARRCVCSSGLQAC